MHDAASQPSWTAPPVVLADRAELAHAAGLLSEAADLAEEAWVAQRVVGDDHGAAATSLLRARIALDLGDREAALDFTATSAAALAAQGRLSLCGAAAGIEIAARREIIEQLGDAERADAAQATMDAMSSALASVEAHSWRSVRLDGLIAAGEIALLAGRREEAERLFRRAEHDRRDSTRSDVHHHVAAALAHRAQGRHVRRPSPRGGLGGARRRGTRCERCTSWEVTGGRRPACSRGWHSPRSSIAGTPRVRSDGSNGCAACHHRRTTSGCSRRPPRSDPSGCAVARRRPRPRRRRRAARRRGVRTRGRARRPSPFGFVRRTTPRAADGHRARG